MEPEAVDASKRNSAHPAVDTAYAQIPDPMTFDQRVAFGTSIHRGCASDRTFNEWHFFAISQAICKYRKQHDIDGRLFLGIDTDALPVSRTKGFNNLTNLRCSGRSC